MQDASSFTIPPPPDYAAYAPVNSRATYAGFWIRVAAYSIDSVVVAALSLLVTRFNIQQAENISSLIGLVYLPLFWSSLLGGATLGMRLFGLRVVGTDGSPIGLPRAYARLFGLILAFLVLYIGLIWIAFDPAKQGWHDKLASTYVIHN